MENIEIKLLCGKYLQGDLNKAEWENFVAHMNYELYNQDFSSEMGKMLKDGCTLTSKKEK
jgi:hypothetical protein